MSKLRDLVLERDDYTCQYCGVKPELTKGVHADHVIAVSRGGPTEKDNLVSACRMCNYGKRNRYWRFWLRLKNPYPEVLQREARIECQIEKYLDYDLRCERLVGSIMGLRGIFDEWEWILRYVVDCFHDKMCDLTRDAWLYDKDLLEKVIDGRSDNRRFAVSSIVNLRSLPLTADLLNFTGVNHEVTVTVNGRRVSITSPLFRGKLWYQINEYIHVRNLWHIQQNNLIKREPPNLLAYAFRLRWPQLESFIMKELGGT